MWRAAKVYRRVPGFRAVKRAWRSRGFGIHSPFAFRFIRFVLREHGEYYAYAELRRISHCKADFSRLSLLFRLVCAFTPRRVILAGDAGVRECKAVTLADSRTAVIGQVGYGYGGANCDRDDANCDRDNAKYANCRDAACSVRNQQEYNRRIPAPFPAARSVPTTNNGETTLLYIRGADDEGLLSLAGDILTEGGVVVCSGISPTRYPRFRSLLADGMSFSSGDTLILVSRPDLPRQDFEINF